MMKNKYKVLIITCWILLILCFIIKLFGANIFNIVVTNQTFIDVCDWFDEHEVFKYIITTIVYITTVYPIYLTMVDKKIGQDWWFILLLLPLSYIKGNWQWVGFALDILILLVVPLIRTKCKNWLKIIIGIVLIMAFQEISLVIRNLGFYLEKDSLLINLIMSIDYYIMIFLYYLHMRYIINKKKEKEAE